MVRDYRRRWLRTDLLAGITVTAYLVPQVMAYATVAGLPPVVGLWTIIPCLLVYALFGSSRLMSIGPSRPPHRCRRRRSDRWPRAMRRATRCSRPRSR